MSKLTHKSLERIFEHELDKGLQLYQTVPAKIMLWFNHPNRDISLSRLTYYCYVAYTLFNTGQISEEDFLANLQAIHSYLIGCKNLHPRVVHVALVGALLRFSVAKMPKRGNVYFLLLTNNWQLAKYSTRSNILDYESRFQILDEVCALDEGTQDRLNFCGDTEGIADWLKRTEPFSQYVLAIKETEEMANIDYAIQDLLEEIVYEDVL